MVTKEQADLLTESENFYRKTLTKEDVEISIYGYLSHEKKYFTEPGSIELNGLTIVDDKVYPSIPKLPKMARKDLKHKSIKKIQKKLEGDLIQFVNINGSLFAKSKTSFDDEVAASAQLILDTSSSLHFFILDCLSNNFFPLFELHDLELTLIAVRNEDGAFIDVDKFNYEFTVESYNIKEIKEDQTYVIKFNDETIIKV